MADVQHDKMKQPFLLGTNWKMHKTFAEADAYAEGLRKLIAGYPMYSYFIIPPYTHLHQMKQALAGAPVKIGAQNMHWADQGAYTGEISPKWLYDLGVEIAELGHSERRQYYHENDEDLNKKVKAALHYDMTPLLCIGEYAKDKAYGVTPEVLRRQLKIGLFGLTAQEAARMWIAYEPVWAIGENGVPADPAYVEQVHGVIRQQLVELYGEETGHAIPILYGGSVNPHNCVALAARSNVDGLFIGRSAWDLTQFSQILQLLTQEHKEEN